uniref:Uncharacterized protein n=1 Tax=Helicotheca tamesis TaxID=374047 RepID=A0A7S2I0T5_9STRA|mmetsp:Transcript_4550/g.6229  ORF Transcript_4550/g.6229 Transcript_4550/m.6229 type:complete len:318 (+) Transcript_4550:159-1112(+)
MPFTMLFLFCLILIGEYAHSSYALVLGQPEDGVTTLGPPFVGYVNNATEGEELLLTIEDKNSTGARFKVEIAGSGAIQGENVFEAPGPGDFYLTVPGRQVGDVVVLVITNLNGEIIPCGRAHCPPGFPPIDIVVTVDQPSEMGRKGIKSGIEVYTKDHHLGNPQTYILSLKVDNNSSQALENFKVLYFFEMGILSLADDPVIFDYFTPLSKPSLKRFCGTPFYALELDYDDLSLSPNESLSDYHSADNLIHIRDANYELLDKNNDFSNPIPSQEMNLPESTLYSLNDLVAVLDESGNLVSGTSWPPLEKYEYAEDCD